MRLVMRAAGVVLGVGMVMVTSGAPVAWAQGPPDAQPTPMHKILESEVGVWDATVKAFEPGSETGQDAGKGVETIRMIGGLWSISDFKGEFGGMPFEGRGCTGYDPKKSKYTGSWCDSMSPRLMLTEGTYDEKTKTMTSLSDGEDMEGKPAKTKMVSVRTGSDTRVFSFYSKADGAKDFVKVMEISYKRRSKDSDKK